MMSTDQIIAKQQVEIENLKEENGIYREAIKDVYSILFGIGGPLNGNFYMYKGYHLIPFRKIAKAINL